MMDDTTTDFRLHRRFDRSGRLLGVGALARLDTALVVVIGLGGVGSHCAEALVRSGVGNITLVDFDLVCVTNTNRQVQALRGQVGQPKASVLAERLRLINPRATITAVPLPYEARIADRLLAGPPDIVIDAIDNVTTKCHLLATCWARGIPVICSTGASGRMDPTRVRVADLTKVKVDRLAASVRKILRQKHGLPRGSAEWGIPAIYSEERLSAPHELAYDRDGEFQCVCPNGDNDVHTCDDRNVVWGTAGFVTAAFGLAATSMAIRTLTGVRPAADQN
ncbi:MAG: tRNA threonylcarbamoyladenosine dehydratase [Myxococcota bacterium]|nr:tRNA threonylcarbamoyladenosine dehydratase [Myxococcota bacterium]